jgi:hypothetical protein
MLFISKALLILAKHRHWRPSPPRRSVLVSPDLLAARAGPRNPRGSEPTETWAEVQAQPHGRRSQETSPTKCPLDRRFAKTSCSISEPTLTTIGRMLHWKDERRIRPCLESRPDCSIRSTSAELPGNRSLFPNRKALPRSSPRYQV